MKQTRKHIRKLENQKKVTNKIKRKDSNYPNQEYNRKHHCQPLKKYIKEYYGYLYDNTLDNLIEMNKCIKRYKVIKPIHEEFRNLNTQTYKKYRD